MPRARNRLQRESSLLVALLLLVVLLNVPFGAYLLFPFALFSTWIHELCHGLVALALGGGIDRILIYPDTSGLAITFQPRGRLATAAVASAGYVGASIAGASLLALRHRPWAARAGPLALGAAMVISALLWVRNGFGLVVVMLVGGALIVAARTLGRESAAWLFTFLAATSCLNALLSIKTLFASQLVVAGRAVATSDAHAVASALFLPHWFWAVVWLLLAIALTAGALAVRPLR